MEYLRQHNLQAVEVCSWGLRRVDIFDQLSGNSHKRYEIIVTQPNEKLTTKLVVSKPVMIVDIID